MNQFPNKAGDHTDTDDILRAELAAAGILTLQQEEGKPPEFLANILREQSGEVKTSVVGVLHGWKFTRAWYYWMASGPGIDADTAQRLQTLHGKVVRVAGHCGSPEPVEWFKGLGVGSYHIDTPEGLKALADAIKKIVDLAKQSREVQFLSKMADLMEQYNAGIATGFEINDDRVHINVDGQVIWKGFLEEISGTNRLREQIAELTKQNL